MPPNWWGAPRKQINTRARDLTNLKSQDDKTIPEGWKVKREERRKRKERDICLTSYTAWWSRMEKDERKFNREVKKEKEKREEENLKKIKKKEETKKMKKVFIQKFFPNCENSPGGTERLVPAESTDSATVEGVEKIRKVISRNYLNCSATNLIRNSHTNTQNNAILKKTSSRLSYITVGQSELSTISEPTNHKPGRSQGLEGGEYKRRSQC